MEEASDDFSVVYEVNDVIAHTDEENGDGTDMDSDEDLTGGECSNSEQGVSDEGAYGSSKIVNQYGKHVAKTGSRKGRKRKAAAALDDRNIELPECRNCNQLIQSGADKGMWICCVHVVDLLKQNYVV